MAARSVPEASPAASADSLRRSAASFRALSRLRSSGRKPARSGSAGAGASTAAKYTVSPPAEDARSDARLPQSVTAATWPGARARTASGSSAENSAPRWSPKAETAAGFIRTIFSPSVPMTGSSADSKSRAMPSVSSFMSDPL